MEARLPELKRRPPGMLPSLGGGPSPEKPRGAAPGLGEAADWTALATPLYRETRLAARGSMCPRAGFVRRAVCRSFNNGRRERPGAGPELRPGLRGRLSAA
jgi:hypothetical protein